MFRKLCLPLDGGGEAGRVLPYVAMLAAKLEAPVVLMSSPGGASAELGGEAVSVAAHRLGTSGVEAITVEGAAATSQDVLRTAIEHECDLILLAVPPAGEDGKASLSQFNAEMLRSAPLPTIVVPAGGGAALPATVVVCLDGSPLAETCLPYAEALARKLSAEIVLIRVPKPVPAYGSSMSGYPAAVELDEAMEAEVTAYLGEVARRLEAGGVAVSWKSLGGTPASSIIEYCQRTPNTIVVMTAHGRSGFTRWLLGSVTEEVVRAAVAPVLVIPHGYGEQYAQQVTDTLGRLPVFSTLSEGERRNLARVVRMVDYRRGDLILEEGEPAKGCHVVVEGEVEVGRRFGGPGETVVSRLGPGDLFGETSVVGDAPYTYSARAADDTRCVSILGEDFRAEMQQHPEIAVDLLPALARRLQDAVEMAASH